MTSRAPIPPSPGAIVLSPRQAAFLLGCSYKTVLALIDDRSLHAVKRRGQYYIRREWVDDLLRDDAGDVA